MNKKVEEKKVTEAAPAKAEATAKASSFKKKKKS